MRDLFIYIDYLYYECDNIILNGGYLEFELDMIVDSVEDFDKVKDRFYKQEDFEIEYCGVGILVPVKNTTIFCTKDKWGLKVWVRINVNTTLA